MTKGQGEEKLRVETCKTPLKTDLVPHSARMEGLGKDINLDTLLLADHQKLTFVTFVWTFDAVYKTYEDLWQESQGNPLCRHALMMICLIK